MFTSFTISHIHELSIVAESNTKYISLVSVPQKHTLLSHSPSSEKVHNLHIVLVFLTPFLFLLFSLVILCHLCLFVHLYHLLDSFCFTSFNVSSLCTVIFSSEVSSSISSFDISITGSSSTSLFKF